jgi:hypothetical protein
MRFRRAVGIVAVHLALGCHTVATHATAPDSGQPDSGQPDIGEPDASSDFDAGTSLPDASSQGGQDGGDAGTTSGTDGGIVLPSGRSFPETNASIAILADQLPSMTASQMIFATSHYVGTQKQLLPVTQQLRALNPNFLVLHYHLAMWQSAPGVNFIDDGTSWGNDYPTVTTHESWFWHNASSQRVTSNADGKLLMNISDSGFQQYWASSLATQVADGQYDAIFLDSASPALLQGECGTARNGSTADPRLAGTAARDTTFPELGNATWIAAWESWITSLSSALSSQGIPLIPNTSAFITGWDNTNYGLTPGIFAEGFAGTGFALSDWQASTNELLSLAAADRIMILQNYLSATTDVATRLYYLGNYLLVKGHHTYLDYFASGPLEWYPEWKIDLGAPTTAMATDVSSLASSGVYRRDFVNGIVLVNPSGSSVNVALGGTYEQVVPAGGGAVDSAGDEPGSLSMQSVASVTVGGRTAVILLRNP